MNKTNYILVAVLLLFGVLCIVLLTRSRSAEPTTPTGSTMTPTNTPLADDEDVILTEKPRTMFLDAEKPDSLSGVALTTHRSQYGYQITYPSAWQIEDYGAKSHVGVLNAWALSPIKPPEHLSPLVVITVYDVATDIYEDIYTGTGTARTLHEPDTTLPQTVIEWNGIRGIYTDGFEGASAYNFLKDGRRYNIMLNNTFLSKANLSKAELQWVLSTFEFTQ